MADPARNRSGHSNNCKQGLVDFGQQVRIDNQFTHTVGVVFFKDIAFTPFTHCIDINLGALGADIPGDLIR